MHIRGDVCGSKYEYVKNIYIYIYVTRIFYVARNLRKFTRGNVGRSGYADGHPSLLSKIKEMDREIEV